MNEKIKVSHLSTANFLGACAMIALLSLMIFVPPSGMAFTLLANSLLKPLKNILFLLIPACLIGFPLLRKALYKKSALKNNSKIAFDVLFGILTVLPLIYIFIFLKASYLG